MSVGIESCDESVGHGCWSRIMALMAISSLRATALVEEHRAIGADHSEHRREDAVLRVVQATTALVVGLANGAAP